MLKICLLYALIVAQVFSAKVLDGNNEVTPKYTPSSIRLGPDSNLCGISIPRNVTKKKYGLIIWLHGGMRSKRQDKGLEAHKALIGFLPKANFYLASPSAFAGVDWLTEQSLQHIDQCITYMLKKYPIDAHNVNLVGVSDGSLGVIRYSLFGKYSPSRLVLFSSYPQIALEGLNQPEQKMFAKGKWYFFQGGKDRLFPAQEVVPLLKKWEQTNPQMKLFYYPEGEHDFSFFAQNCVAEITKIFSTP